ncbi:MAG: molybdenum cofactor biosysynthesis protein [Opitutaceae bacterium]|nr:molybdenum cofactor biosysynthesis protein [Opitutaceae bacterium]
MRSVESAHVIPGRGIEGDRYFTGGGTFSPNPQRPDFEITFIAQEAIDAFVAESGAAFTGKDARRNVVTRGIDLNALVGCEFLVGELRFRGIRLCEPCNYLAKITGPVVLRGLVHRGGLRTQILTEGGIRVGDAIRVV